MSSLRLLRAWPARLAVILVVLALPCVAYGYWSGGPSTTTTSLKLSDIVPLVLSSGAVSGELSPGQSGDVEVVVSNPNTVSIHIGSFVAVGTSAPITVDAAHSGCGVSALTFTTQTNGGAGWSVPPAVGATDGTVTVDLVGSLAMSASAANACQGAQFAVPLDVDP